MKKIFIVLIIGFTASMAFAIPPESPGTKKSGNIVITKSNKALKLPQFTVATLPTLVSSEAGGMVQVIDGADSSDCTVGSGAEVVTCRWSGSAWVSIGDGVGAGTASGTVADLDGTGSAGVAATHSRGDHKHAVTPAGIGAQPVEATLTDIADGTIAENLVNTANPWADNEVADDITASNYLPLAGGTLTDELTVDENGIEFQETDTLTDCSTFAATSGGIFYDDSEGKFKKCQDNVLTDLDTDTGGATAYNSIGDPTGAGSISFDDGETATYDGAWDTEVAITISLNAADLTGDTTALLITAVDNDDANYIPLLIQDDQDGTPDTLFSVDYTGKVTAAGGFATTSTDDPTASLIPATASESSWYYGINNDSEGDDDDPFEIRQSATPGTSVAVAVYPNRIQTALPFMGGINPVSKTTDYTVGTDNAFEAYGSLFINGDNDAQVWTLPSAVSGMSACFFQANGVSAAVTVTPASGDYLLKDGARGTVATAYTSTGAGADALCVVAISADDWLITRESGTWSE